MALASIPGHTLHVETGQSSAVNTHAQPRCYLCGEESAVLYKSLADRIFSAPGRWSLRRCQGSSCGLIWLDPQPEPGEIFKLYAGYYTGSAAKETRPLRKWVRSKVLAATLGYDACTTRYDKTLGYLLAIVPTIRDMSAATVLHLAAEWRGRVLDVGCGNGVLLKNLKELGWTVYGLDPDPNAVAVTNQVIGPKATAGEIDSLEPTASFDAITMNHVIEHLPDPIATLRECLLRLRPGGHLVLQTPNAESLGARMFGQAWIPWDPPRHLYLFTMGTLRRAVEEAGFLVDEVRTSARDAHFIWTVSQEIRRRGDAQKAFLCRRSGRLDTIVSGLFQVVESFAGRKAGEEVVLIAHRP
ncbi:MAG: class I SAM-dependent methyltransferase [Terriglobales bacterium]